MAIPVVCEINTGTKIQHGVCRTEPIPYLLMHWWLQRPLHQQQWYWLILKGGSWMQGCQVLLNFSILLLISHFCYWNFGQNTEICLNFSVFLHKNTEICVRFCKNTEISVICYWSVLPEVGSPVNELGCLWNENTTHWPLGDVLIIAGHMLWKGSWVPPATLLSGERHRTPLMLGQHWFK